MCVCASVRNSTEILLTVYHIHCFQLSKKYGSVFTVYFGPRKVVVLSGYETMKEALVNYADVFGEKDPPEIAQEFSQGHGKEKKTGLIPNDF